MSRDHLDYHQTFEAYFAAKKKLFDRLKTEAIAVTNLDDSKGKEMVAAVNAKAGISDEQAKAFAELNAGRMEFQKSVVAMLTDEQKAKLPKQMTRGGGKKGDAKKGDAKKGDAKGKKKAAKDAA